MLWQSQAQSHVVCWWLQDWLRTSPRPAATQSCDRDCAAAGMVEVWLQKLVDGMQGTVKATIKRAYRNVQEMALEDFIFSHPAQIALLGIQFQWTGDTQVSAA